MPDCGRLDSVVKVLVRNWQELACGQLVLMDDSNSIVQNGKG